MTSLYAKLLLKYPLRVQALTTGKPFTYLQIGMELGSLFAIGDVAAQQQNKQKQKHDYARTLRMAAYGTCVAVSLCFTSALQ